MKPRPGQHAPTDPVSALADRIAYLEQRLGDVERAGQLSRPLARNLLLNGDFRVGQAGYGGTANGDYIADQWRLIRSGSTCTVTVADPTATDIGNGWPDNARYAQLATTSSAGSGNYVSLYQPIENVRRTAGRWVVVSFRAAADAACNVAVELQQNFGSGGSSSVLGIGSQLVAIPATNPRRVVTVPIFVPSITGKTIGAGDYLTANIWTDAGSTFNARAASLGQQSRTIKISEVQLEEGAATPFEWRTYAEQLADCQRYAFVANTTAAPFAALGLGVTANSTTASYVQLQLPVPMRIAPNFHTATGSHRVFGANGVAVAISSFTLSATSTPTIASFDVAHSSITSSQQPVWWGANNDSTCRMLVSARL